jgi:hypothetical protein
MNNASAKNLSLQDSQECVGDSILNAKNVLFSYSIYNSRDSKYCYVSDKINDCYDVVECFETDLLYEAHAVMESYMIVFSNISYNNKFSYYLDNCYNNQNLFGCV